MPDELSPLDQVIAAWDSSGDLHEHAATAPSLRLTRVKRSNEGDRHRRLIPAVHAVEAWFAALGYGIAVAEEDIFWTHLLDREGRIFAPRYGSGLTPATPPRAPGRAVEMSRVA